MQVRFDRWTTKPNFFIVGAPKSGTTSLHRYLRSHPEVFMPDIKATHFLSTDLSRRFRLTEAQYIQLFQAGLGKKRIGEASTDYMYSEVACQKIKEIAVDPRIIFILRNPVDKVYSGHAQRLWRGWESIEDFEEALAADEEEHGRHRPETRLSTQVGMISYRDSARYAKHVRRYIDAFGRERVHVIIFEEFFGNPEEGFKTLCGFLEVREDVPVHFEVHNSSKKAKSGSVSRFLNQASRGRRLARRLPEPARRMPRSLARAIMRWNTHVEKRPPLPPEIRQRLESEFASDVEELQTLLQRDLSACWFSVSQYAATGPR